MVRKAITRKQQFQLGRAIEITLSEEKLDKPVDSDTFTTIVRKHYKIAGPEPLPPKFSWRQIRDVADLINVDLGGIVKPKHGQSFARHIERVAELEERVAKLEKVMEGLA